MRISILVITLFSFVFHPGSAIAVERHSPIPSEPNLAIIQLNAPNEAGTENFQLDRKTLERHLGRKLGRLEQIGFWIAGKKLKKVGRQMDSEKSREKLIRKALVITHKTSNKKIYILTGQEIVFLTRNTALRQEGRLVDFDGSDLIIEFQNGFVGAVPLHRIIGIRKKSGDGFGLRIFGALLTILGIALIVSGKKEEKSAYQSSPTDAEGCLTILIGSTVALLGIVFGGVILVIGILAFIVGLARTQKRYFDLTENSDWKAEIRDVPDRELP